MPGQNNLEQGRQEFLKKTWSKVLSPFGGYILRGNLFTLEGCGIETLTIVQLLSIASSIPDSVSLLDLSRNRLDKLRA